jgi:hypothetical protein
MMTHSHSFIIPSPPAKPLGKCTECGKTRMMDNVGGAEYNPWAWVKRKQQAIELGTEMRGAVPWAQ